MQSQAASGRAGRKTATRFPILFDESPPEADVDERVVPNRLTVDTSELVDVFGYAPVEARPPGRWRRFVGRLVSFVVSAACARGYGLDVVDELSQAIRVASVKINRNRHEANKTLDVMRRHTEAVESDAEGRREFEKFRAVAHAVSASSGESMNALNRLIGDVRPFVSRHIGKRPPARDGGMP